MFKKSVLYKSKANSFVMCTVNVFHLDQSKILLFRSKRFGINRMPLDKNCLSMNTSCVIQIGRTVSPFTP